VKRFCGKKSREKGGKAGGSQPFGVREACSGLRTFTISNEERQLGSLGKRNEAQRVLTPRIHELKEFLSWFSKKKV